MWKKINKNITDQFSLATRFFQLLDISQMQKIYINALNFLIHVYLKIYLKKKKNISFVNAFFSEFWPLFFYLLILRYHFRRNNFISRLFSLSAVIDIKITFNVFCMFDAFEIAMKFGELMFIPCVARQTRYSDYAVVNILVVYSTYMREQAGEKNREL